MDSETLLYKEESYKIIVEIKAVKHVTDEHRVRIINYLTTTGKQLGLLINSGQHPNLKHERFIKQKYPRDQRD